MLQNSNVVKKNQTKAAFPCIYLWMRNANSSHCDLSQLLAIPLIQLWAFLDLLIYRVYDFSSMCCFLNHFSPICGNLVTWAIISSERWRVIFHIWAIFPSKDSVNCLVTSKLIPENLWRNGIHDALWRILNPFESTFPIINRLGTILTAIFIYIFFVCKNKMKDCFQNFHF